MKLVVLFMLVTIPICCYASGSGCSILDNVINATIDSSVSVDDYLKLVDPYVHTSFGENAMTQLKQCFLDQDQETLDNVDVMMNVIYNSQQCPQSS
ncbi:secretoglobin family 2A member 2-like [Apodemus sylvaticus]|uniref:secretoglobin family 2A member 2-like n=1 Tax=Apodemus sylvaticus TaxID=10129 RepID=UPI0022428342|nr:secretoglobin family 2A member 2-like [Apodemus sylvaticus]